MFRLGFELTLDRALLRGAPPPRAPPPPRRWADTVIPDTRTATARMAKIRVDLFIGLPLFLGDVRVTLSEDHALGISGRTEDKSVVVEGRSEIPGESIAMLRSGL